MSTTPPSGASGFWTADRIATALASVAEVNLPRGDQPFDRVWTDTRTVGPGDLFVALAGERFDAHTFVAEAVAKGAAGVVVSRDVGRVGVPVFMVPDTLVALGELATYRRRAWGKTVVAVAGSNGKTSTKELLRAALGSRLEVYATTGNLNNLVGVPLTLLALPDEAELAVIEMGTNQPGEVARLRAMVLPDITVITSIAEEHLEGLGDLAGVLREELSACDAVAIAIVPANQPEVVEAARGRAAHTIAAGLEAGALQAASFTVDQTGAGRLTVEGTVIEVPLRGIHNLRNAMLALAVAREIGVPMEDAARGIAAMPAPPMRTQVEQHGRLTLINDAYNANPGSTRAALDLLGQTGTGRQRVAVLGSMLELGGQSDRLHEEILRAALGGPIDLVIGVGEFAAALDRLTVADPRAIAVADPTAVWMTIASRVRPDAVILLKGSRGMRLERIVPEIMRWGAASPP